MRIIQRLQYLMLTWVYIRKDSIFSHPHLIASQKKKKPQTKHPGLTTQAAGTPGSV